MQVAAGKGIFTGVLRPVIAFTLALNDLIFARCIRVKAVCIDTPENFTPFELWQIWVFSRFTVRRNSSSR